MNLDEATMKLWPRALENSGLWRPGQGCATWEWALNPSANAERLGICEHGISEPHDIPPPELAHALLWKMLEKGLKRDMHFTRKLDDQFLNGKSPAAAVIRASAASKDHLSGCPDCIVPRPAQGKRPPAMPSAVRKER